MRLLLLAAFAMLLAPCAVARTSPSAGRPIPSRQSRFSIPFHVDARSPPAEVRLYVRGGHAGSWRLAARAQPSDRRFQFSAPQDGQFAFSIRNVDASGREFPSGPHVAGLSVLVDTREPTLHVVSTSNAPGEVTVRWQTADANPQASTLRIEYRADPRAAWRTVAIGPAERHRRSATWRSDDPRAVVELRAEVSDVAGNRAVWSGRVDLSSRSTSEVWNARAPGTFAANRQRRDGSVAWSQVQREKAQPRRPADSWASASGSARQQSRSGVPPLSSEFATRHHRLTRQDATSTLPANDAAGWQAANKAPINPSRFSTATNARGLNVTGGNRQLPRIVTSQAGRAVGSSTVRSVNTSRLEIPYDDQLVARSGGRVVQVWWTGDEGRTWRLLDTDRDIRSPAVVTVDLDGRGEGTFGFRIVAIGAREAIGQPPRAGEKPQIMFAVDLTRPAVRVTSVKPTSAEVLSVRWQATDRRLAERPISLSYSVTPTGLRTRIVDDITNTGQYLWRFDGRVPEQIYLHATAKDAAGNTGQATWGQAVSRPRGGAIRDVRPTGTSATRPRQYQFY